MKNILCVSLTPIHRDARVLRQIEMLSRMGRVTTVGFGPKPPGSSLHIQVPDGLPTLPQTLSGVTLLAFRQHKKVVLQSPAHKWVMKQKISGPWDLVVANDARVLDLAFALADQAPVWADMHEWAPEERTHIFSWRMLVAPFMTYLCETFLPKAKLVTTVSQGIIELYAQHFHIHPLLFPNAGPYQNLNPQEPEVSAQIACVHSGAAIHGRGLEQMIRIFSELPEKYTLDLYLVPGGDQGKHLNDLKALADGCSRIHFHDPVTPDKLPETLNSYDVGVFWIPPTHTNARLTLPNKFFDYVQARLAVAIGPSTEMMREVRQWEFGTISSSFLDDDLKASLLSLDRAEIERMKKKSHLAAKELNFAAMTQETQEALVSILGR